jgi:hypothetical protein
MISETLNRLLEEVEALAFAENTLNNSDDCKEMFGKYECTRPLGHSGFHIAIGGRMITVWNVNLKESTK